MASAGLKVRRDTYAFFGVFPFFSADRLTPGSASAAVQCPTRDRKVPPPPEVGAPVERGLLAVTALDRALLAARTCPSALRSSWSHEKPIDSERPSVPDERPHARTPGLGGDPRRSRRHDPVPRGLRVGAVDRSLHHAGGSPCSGGEVVLVHDCGPDASHRVIRERRLRTPGSGRSGSAATSVNTPQRSPGCRPRAATGSPRSTKTVNTTRRTWAAARRALDVQADVVYAEPVNPPPHGFLRNLASRVAKRSVRLLSGRPGAEIFHSYRFMLGDVARSVAAYSVRGVDLTWP